MPLIVLLVLPVQEVLLLVLVKQALTVRAVLVIRAPTVFPSILTYVLTLLGIDVYLLENLKTNQCGQSLKHFFRVWANVKICYIDQTIDADMANEFTIQEMKVTCSYEPSWVPEMHGSPVTVNKYVDYLYSLSDSHSVNLMQKNYKRLLYAMRSFKLKQVKNLVEVKQDKATFVDYINIPHCVYILFLKKGAFISE